MAYTINRTKTAFGNMRVSIMSCTADAATQNIQSGLDRVIGVTMTPVSMATFNSHSMYPNVLAAGTASAGYVSVTGLASGDEFHLVCFGT